MHILKRNGTTYTFDTIAEFDAFVATYSDADDNAEVNERTELEVWKDRFLTAEVRCKDLYVTTFAKLLKGGLLGETRTKQRNIDTAIAPFMVPLYMGRVVAAIEGIRAVTATTITNHSPYITAAALLKLRNELHKVLNIPLATNYNDAL